MLRQSKVTIRDADMDFIPGTLVQLGGDWHYSHTVGKFNYYVLLIRDNS